MSWTERIQHTLNGWGVFTLLSPRAIKGQWSFTVQYSII
jgi:hypothetical protein